MLQSSSDIRPSGAETGPSAAPTARLPTRYLDSPLTERALERLLAEADPRVDTVIRDKGARDSLPGLVVRARQGRVTFEILKRLNGKLIRRTLGERAILNLTQARRCGRDLLSQLAQGRDPREERKAAQVAQSVRALTFGDALDDYLAGAKLRPATVRHYQQALRTFPPDTPMGTLTPERVAALHRARSQTAPSAADQAARVLRAVWFSCAGRYGDEHFPGNPVGKGMKREWNGLHRRERVIPEHLLPEWFATLAALRRQGRGRGLGAVAAELMTLTGLRRTETARIAWAHVNLTAGTLTLPGEITKNRHTLVRPLTRRTAELFRSLAPGEGLVFGEKMTDPEAISQLIYRTVAQAGRVLGIQLSPHDLRRTFSSAAARVAVPHVALKRLLNHLGGTDVTEGYVRTHLEQLREYAQGIEDFMLGAPPPTASQSDANLDVDALLAGLTPEQRRALAQRLMGAA